MTKPLLPTKRYFRKELVVPMLLPIAVVLFLAWEYDPRGVLDLLMVPPLAILVVTAVTLPLLLIRMLTRRLRRPVPPRA
jgi:hypothetical protein